MKKYRQRIHYTEANKAMMWDRWQQGETLHSIVRLFDRLFSIGIRPANDSCFLT